MGKISASNYSVSTIIPKQAVAAIDGRRAGQSMTRSKYIGLIVAKWFAEGCPPVNEADRAIKTLNALQSKERKKSA